MVDAARSGEDPAPDDAGFRDWMIVRSSTLRRKAFLLCGDWSSADDLVQDVLVAMYPRWSRIARGGNVDAYANKVLVVASSASLLLFGFGSPLWQVPCTALIVFSFLEWGLSFCAACWVYGAWYCRFPPTAA